MASRVESRQSRLNTAASSLCGGDKASVNEVNLLIIVLKIYLQFDLAHSHTVLYLVRGGGVCDSRTNEGEVV